MAVTEIIKKTLETFANGSEGFQEDNATTPLPPPTTSQFFVLTVVIMLWFLLTIMVSKYLWNECLCKVLTICKPTDDLFVIFGIIILFDILRPTF
jgi:hypothetical protein